MDYDKIYEKHLTDPFFCSIMVTTRKDSPNSIGIRAVGEHLDDTLEWH